MHLFDEFILIRIECFCYGVIFHTLFLLVKSKKLQGFNPDHVEIVTSRVIQKITTQFVKHLKQEDTAADVSIDVISKIFNIEALSYKEND